MQLLRRLCCDFGRFVVPSRTVGLFLLSIHAEVSFFSDIVPFEVPVVQRCSLLDVPQEGRETGAGPGEYLLLDGGPGTRRWFVGRLCAFVPDAGIVSNVWLCAMACVHNKFAAFHLQLLVIRVSGLLSR